MVLDFFFLSTFRLSVEDTSSPASCRHQLWLYPPLLFSPPRPSFTTTTTTTLSSALPQLSNSNPSQPSSPPNQQNGVWTVGRPRRLSSSQNIPTKTSFSLFLTLSQHSLQSCSLARPEALKRNWDRLLLEMLSCFRVVIVLRVLKNSMPITFVTLFVFFFR